MKEKEPFLDFDLSLKLLSEQTGIDSAQLSQVINEHFDQNFKDFINTYRIERAKALLTGPEGLITKEVMYNSGFQSKSTFNPVFKKHMGMNRSQYRSGLKESKKK
jgi:AraC-like DNA-binding protein